MPAHAPPAGCHCQATPFGGRLPLCPAASVDVWQGMHSYEHGAGLQLPAGLPPSACQLCKQNTITLKTASFRSMPSLWKLRNMSFEAAAGLHHRIYYIIDSTMRKLTTQHLRSESANKRDHPLYGSAVSTVTYNQTVLACSSPFKDRSWCSSKVLTRLWISLYTRQQHRDYPTHREHQTRRQYEAYLMKMVFVKTEALRCLR